MQNVQLYSGSLSPKDFASALGVSESSVKRWVDDGKISALRTPGGHRRIAVSEAIRFVRATSSPVPRPEMLGLRELEGRSIVRGADSAAVSSAFHAALLDGHALEARALLVQAYLAGAGLADLCDGPIRSSLTLLGELWHHDQAGVFIEHRATAIVVEALSHLRTLLAVRSNAPVAVGCAPAGDPYVVPTLAASVALAGEGFDVTNLGPETPMLSLSLAIERLHPSLVWISASSAAGADAVVVASEPVLRAVERAGATLLVGGRLFESGSLPVAEGVAFGRTISDLVTFARGLQTRGVRGDGVVGA